MAGSWPDRLPARAVRYVSWRAGRALAPADPTFHRLTARLRLRPTFLVIGAQKAGTTSLYANLCRHPSVVCAHPKEVHYFNESYQRGELWYLTHFPLATRAVSVRLRTGVQLAVGEVTPAYLFHPLVPARVHALAPKMKLVAILRDPVERAYSQYRMQVRGHGIGHTGTFEHALERELVELPEELDRIAHDPAYVSPTGLWRSYMARGCYAEQLDRWLKWFPREQLLVLTSEELRTNPQSTMATVAEFLGVPPREAETYAHRSVTEREPLPPEIRERLAETFEPHNRRLEQMLARKLPWTRPGVESTSPTVVEAVSRP